MDTCAHRQRAAWITTTPRVHPRDCLRIYQIIVNHAVLLGMPFKLLLKQVGYGEKNVQFCVSCDGFKAVRTTS